MLGISLIKHSLLVLFLMTACSSSKKQTAKSIDEVKNKRPVNPSELDKQGHRGCRGLMPENTIAAMEHALGMGVTTLEMDVVITKDHKVVLSHEPFFNHEISTQPDGSPVTEAEEKTLNIFKMDYETVKRYDVGLKAHPRFPRQQKLAAVKPLLSDVLEAVKQYMMMARRPYPYFNIETKCLPETDLLYHPKPAEFVDLLMGVIKEKQLEAQVIIQSFDIRTLQYLHEHYPDIKTALLVETDVKGPLDVQLQQLGFIPTVYSPEYVLVTEAMINACHQKGMKIIPWTVNEKEKIDALTKMGVDGIITDYPDLF